MRWGFVVHIVGFDDAIQAGIHLAKFQWEANEGPEGGG